MARPLLPDESCPSCGRCRVLIRLTLVAVLADLGAQLWLSWL